MPSDDGLRLDEDQCRTPPAPGGRQQDPKHSVTSAEVRPLHASLQGSQLVAEGKILKDHVVVAPAGHGDRTQEQQREFKHVPILPGVPAESNTGSAKTTFWRTTSRLSRAWDGCRTAVVIVKPETVVAWHRQGFRLFWTWKSRRRHGRPPVAPDARALIRTISEQNPLCGAPRIHGELVKLGIDVSQATVAKYMARRRRPPSQTWRTFLTNHLHQIVAADFFVVPTATCRLLFVLVILAHDRRRVVHTAVTAHPTAAWTAQQFREAFPWDQVPRYLVRDRDRAFQAVKATAEAMGIEEMLTAPRSPWQNAYAERFIGSVRRECLDHVIVLSAAGLRKILKS